MMGLDKYGMIAGVAFMALQLVQMVFLNRNLAKTYDKRVSDAKTAGKSPPNDNLVKLAQLPGIPLFAYVGYTYIGPILADFMGAQ